MNKKLKLFFPLISCAITFSAMAETNLNVKTDDFQTTVNITSYYRSGATYLICADDSYPNLPKK